jgi:TPR repeat protein
MLIAVGPIGGRRVVRTWKLVGLVLGGLALGAGQAWGEERPVAVVFELEDRGRVLRAADRHQLTDYLTSLLTRGGYQVVPRAQIKERLADAKAGSYKACYDQACQIELGRELAAQKSLASQVLKFGKTCKVTLDLYDLKRAASAGAGTADCRSCAVEDVVKCLEEAARSLPPGSTPPVPTATTEPAPAPAPAGELTEVGERIAAYERGEREHAYDIGMAYLKGESGAPQNYTKARQWFDKAATHGDAAAFVELGDRFLWGQGARKNVREALKWYRKAAEAGEPAGAEKLAAMLHNGEGAAQNHPEAARWYRLAAEKGERAEPCEALGRMYSEGLGVAQDKAEALKWYRLAYERGDVSVAPMISMIYENGAAGVPADKQKALDWLLEGALHNYAPAMEYLGEAYAGKRYPPLCEPDPVEAYKWLAVYIAKEAQTAPAEKLLAEVKARLSPADLARAEKQAAELIERYVTPRDLEEKAHFKAHPERYR